MIKNSCLTELIEAKTIEEILSKTEGARKEAKELNDKSLIILLYNLSYYKFFERTKDKEIEIFQLQKQQLRNKSRTRTIWGSAKFSPTTCSSWNSTAQTVGTMPESFPSGTFRCIPRPPRCITARKSLRD